MISIWCYVSRMLPTSRTVIRRRREMALLGGLQMAIHILAYMQDQGGSKKTNLLAAVQKTDTNGRAKSHTTIR
jgi:hypothetical protein